MGSIGSLFSCSISDSLVGIWDCVCNFVKNYLFNGNNFKGVVIKIVVVGFGKNFNSVLLYDKIKSIVDNVILINVFSVSFN